ncbi:MAG: heavy metal translocating P-type ATPase [Hyphomicrobiales bacterium]
MACCDTATQDSRPEPVSADITSGFEPWVREGQNGARRIDLLAPGIHCAGCISRIEKALKATPGVTHARVNLSTRRIAIEWEDGKADAEELAGAVSALGYDVRPFNPEEAGVAAENETGRALLRALAVAGFAAANIMLLSVSVWSGADGPTRDLFHWLSALIAIPAIGYAGQPFFRSAWRALSNRTLNMDVPISLAVLLAAGLSLYEVSRHGEEAFFDASVTLLFFLLIGRYLDHMMRSNARSAVTQLLSLNATGANVVGSHGENAFMPIDKVKPGMVVAVAVGEKIPVDGEVIIGVSDVDRSMVTGESVPDPAEPGTAVQAGTVNLSGPLEIRVTAVGEDTFLAEIVRLMEAAEEGKAGYMRLADRAAQVYAPVVHILAVLTFLGWMWWTGGDWRMSIFTAVAVLIITCPCALGLAVPAVQIVASGMLFKRGIYLKDGTALERLAEIDTVLFDKTGTLTVGAPKLSGQVNADPQTLAIAGGLAKNSSHPLSRALMGAIRELGIKPANVTGVTEHPGHGLEGKFSGQTVRLGKRDWCSADKDADVRAESDGLLEICLSVAGKKAVFFRFEDEIRADASSVVREFERLGCETGIVSGDRQSAVAKVAGQTGVQHFHAGWTPQEKASYIADLERSGRKALMVGDGINDAPALAAAHASMAPSSASDVGRMAADLVFVGVRLGPVFTSWQIAKGARRHITQNFAIAAVYNMIAVPVAVLGFASPLVAAVAMSVSSLIVTGNALRLRLMGGLEFEQNQLAPTSSDADASAVDRSGERQAA